MKEDELEIGRVAVYTPDMKVISQESFKKPFILVGELPVGATILDVHPIPNILDVMGMPSGGGPPGFSVLEPTVRRVPELRLIAGFLPGAEITVKSKALWWAGVVGTCITVGLVVNYLEFLIEETDGAPDITSKEEVIAFIEQNGYLPVPLVEYTTPDVLLRGMAAATPGAPGG